MTVVGTVSFMAPELIKAARHYTTAIDIYALGMTFWEIWTGQDPYESITQFEIYDRVSKGLRPEMPEDVPDGLRAAMESMWLDDGSKRPNASAVLEKLEETSADFRSQLHRRASTDSTLSSSSIETTVVSRSRSRLASLAEAAALVTAEVTVVEEGATTTSGEVNSSSDIASIATTNVTADVEMVKRSTDNPHSSSVAYGEQRSVSPLHASSAAIELPTATPTDESISQPHDRDGNVSLENNNGGGGATANPMHTY
jgi:serine/threonine protein kinase